MWVHLLTTIHAPEYDASVPAADRTVKRKGKRGERDGIDVPSPPCISDYNSFMGGVDFADRIVKYYNCARRSRRWNRRVIFHLLELSIHNTYVIDSFFNDHRSATNVLMLKHQSFREELADQLVGGFRNGRKRVGRPSDMYATEARLQNARLHHPSSDVSKDCIVYEKGQSIATWWRDSTRCESTRFGHPSIEHQMCAVQCAFVCQK